MFLKISLNSLRNIYSSVILKLQVGFIFPNIRRTFPNSHFSLMLISAMPRCWYFCWLLPLLIQSDAVKYEISMTNYSQDITKKQFHWRLPVLPHKQSLLRNRYLEEINFTFFLKEKYCINKNVHRYFTKSYQTSDFISKLIAALESLEVEILY